MKPQIFIINGQMYERMRDGRLQIIRPNWKTGKYDMFPGYFPYGMNQLVGLAGPGGQSPPFNPIAPNPTKPGPITIQPYPGPITTLPVEPIIPPEPTMTIQPYPYPGPITTLPVEPIPPPGPTMTILPVTQPVPLPVPGECVEYVDNQGCLNVICRKSNGRLTTQKNCSQAVNAPVGLSAPMTTKGINKAPPGCAGVFGKPQYYCPPCNRGGYTPGNYRSNGTFLGPPQQYQLDDCLFFQENGYLAEGATCANCQQ